MRQSIVAVIVLLCGICGCTKDRSNPVNEPAEAINWEGHGQLFNEAYRDSVLFTSSRCLGTQFSPSVHMMYKDGTGKRAITKEWFTFGGTWSPRKWKILFVRDESYGRPVRSLCCMNADGSNVQRLTQPVEDVYGAEWSPDGQKIAYVELDTTTGVAGRARIKTMNPDGSNSQPISTWYGNFSRLSWSMDSKQIVFSAIQDGHQSILRVNANGTGLQVLRSNYAGCYDPTYSPDGNSLAYMSPVYIDGSYCAKIFIFDLQTSQARILTTLPTDDVWPTWSDDSRWLMFTSHPRGKWYDTLFRIRVDGTELTQLTDSTGVDYVPCWYK